MYCSVNGVDLFYTAIGSGMPIVTLHGGMGLDHTYFRPWMDPLADRFQLVYYDQRGNGISGGIGDFEKFDPATWVDDADALRKHLTHEKIILFGHSCGGFVALEYALRYPQHLAGLILCCTTPVMDYSDVVMTNAQKKGTPEQVQMLIKAFSQPLSNNDQMRDIYGNIFSIYMRNYDHQIASNIVNAIHYNYQAFNYTTARLFPQFNRLNALSDITVPTLIIAAKDDWIMPPAQGANRLHAGIRDSRLVVFEKSGHFPFVEEQSLFNKTISDWASSLM